MLIKSENVSVVRGKKEILKNKKNDTYQLQVIPRRLMGRVSPVDIEIKGELVVKKGDRISARHIRKIEGAKLKLLIHLV